MPEWKKKLWFGSITTKYWVRHASACSFEASYFKTLLVSHETRNRHQSKRCGSGLGSRTHHRQTVKVFIFGAQEWCRSIFDTRKIFVASRDLFVIDPLNLFTHKSYRRGRIRMQYELYIHISRLLLQYIFQIETLI